jgi:hypothetical protein
LGKWADEVKAAGITGEDLAELADANSVADAFGIGKFVVKKVATTIGALLMANNDQTNDQTTNDKQKQSERATSTPNTKPTKKTTSKSDLESTDLLDNKQYAAFISHRKVFFFAVPSFQ